MLDYTKLTVNLGDHQQVQLSDQFFQSYPELFEIHIVDQKPNHSIRLNAPISVDEDDFFGIDINAEHRNLLISETRNEIMKKPISEAFLSSSTKIDMNALIKLEKRENRLSKILDNKKARDKTNHQIFYDLLMRHHQGGEYFITNNKIGAFISDFREYLPSSDNTFPLVHGGKLMGMDIYFDSYMKPDDDRIVILNDKIKLFLSKPIIEDEPGGIKISIYRNSIIPESKVLDFTESKFDFLI